VDHLDHFGQTLFWLYLLIPGFWKASLLVSGWILDISLYFRREILLGYSIGVELSFLKILVIFVMLAYNSVDHKKGITFSSTQFFPPEKYLLCFLVNRAASINPRKIFGRKKN